MIRRLVTVFALAGIAACSDPLRVSDGVLVVNPQPPGINIRNASEAAVHLFATDRGFLEVMNWVPCAGPSCASLPAGGSELRSCDEIAGCTADTREVVVFWWRSVPDGIGGFRADSIRSLVTRVN